MLWCVVLLAAPACSEGQPAPEVVSHLDLLRYAGTWYEIASIPISQQEGCVATRAHYGLEEDDTIRVINTCLDGADGSVRWIEGTAEIRDPEEPAKLRVQFLWPFKSDYWVLELDPGYQWALVGTPSRKHAWILSRSLSLDSSIVSHLLQRLRQDGYPTEQLRPTAQPTNSR